jgi:SAM-dependent methyltransferase
MNDVREHYRRLLAPIYAWMVGGVEAARDRHRSMLRKFGFDRSPGRAVDLGAGFGSTSLALAELGWHVTAVDTSEHLLDELDRRRGSLPIRVERADLVDFAARADEPVGLAVCIGDTLTHLESRERVTALFDALSRLVARDGHLLLAFRDYVTKPLEDAQRFIPVRSDDQRIHTCFLETRGEQLIVHDVVYDRDGAAWKFSASAYPKLRLAPEWVVAELAARGFVAERRDVDHGMPVISFRRG